MKNGREYWNLKIEETKELFAKRPVWMENFDNDFPSAAFIKGLISDYKPENMLEVGTAAGWAAYYMLEEALKYRKNVKLTSIILLNLYIIQREEKSVLHFLKLLLSWLNIGICARKLH